MNYHIDGQLKNMIAMVHTFQQGCRMAAMQDDGAIDRDEAKILKRIDAACASFVKELEKISK